MQTKISVVASIATTSFDKIKTENIPKDAGGLISYFKTVKAQKIQNMLKASMKANRPLKEALKLKEIK